MTTNHSPALILNDDIRAYLAKPGTKESYEDTLTALKEETNVQLAKDFNDLDSTLKCNVFRNND